MKSPRDQMLDELSPIQQDARDTMALEYFKEIAPAIEESVTFAFVVCDSVDDFKRAALSLLIFGLLNKYAPNASPDQINAVTNAFDTLTYPQFECHNPYSAGVIAELKKLEGKGV